MLGFILSKMQMLFFAVGIAVVAFLFLNFVSVIGLQSSADALLNSNIKLVSDQVTSDVACSFKQTTIPDRLVYGASNSPFFYDLEFIKQSLTTGSDSPSPSVLIMRISEHQVVRAGGVADLAKKKVISAKSITSESEFILIDPAFLADLTPLNETTYNVSSISLYPRAASAQGIAASPNGFVALKNGDEKTIYIIPCASEKEPNNCLMNIFRVGCYKLKMEHPEKTQDTLLDSCFNIILPSTDNSEKTKNYTWRDCVTMFPGIN
jgi:hypothetical protein